MPLSIADTIFNWANLLLVFGGLITVAATVLVFWTTGIRERYADERISANEALTAQAKAESAEAQKLTAGIEAENLRLRTKLEEERTARLLLEKSIAPRRLTSGQKERLASALLAFAGQSVRVISPQNTEGNDYALDFIQVFSRAGWRVLDSGTSTGVTFIGYDIEPRGIQLGVAQEASESSNVRVAGATLAKVLLEEELRSSEKLDVPFVMDGVDILEFGVGVKPDIIQK